MPEIRFAKTRAGATIPSKRDEDAGYDLYACFEEEYMLIMPHETRMIPTGIASAFDSGYVFVIKERGSTGTRGIAQRSGVIDSGFRGEWMCPVTNVNPHPIAIVKAQAQLPEGVQRYPYEKAIAQALFLKLPEAQIIETDYDSLKGISSERGSGMLGSSSK